MIMSENLIWNLPKWVDRMSKQHAMSYIVEDFNGEMINAEEVLFKTIIDKKMFYFDIL